jgi:hypothetical protein
MSSRRHSITFDPAPETLAEIFEKGCFPGRRIVLSDPDDPWKRTRNVYEDLDQETPDAPRLAVVTIFPEHAQAMAKGDSASGLVTMTHEEAVKDMKTMIDRFGYVITEISRDI